MTSNAVRLTECDTNSSWSQIAGLATAIHAAASALPDPWMGGSGSPKTMKG
jgi:hypothetical protein